MNRAGLALGGVTAAVLLTLGAGAGALWTASDTPEALASATPVTRIPITVQPFTDARTVELTVTSGPSSALSSVTDGRVTEFGCAPGAMAESGGWTLALNGDRLLNLATSVPLWRDLTVGDRGDDVAALQTELVRLGHQVRTDGRLDLGTWSATDAAIRAVEGTALPARSIPFARVLWLPRASVQIASCETVPGSVVAAGDPVATLSSPLSAVALTRVPDGAVTGARTITIDQVTVAVAGDGTVSDPAAREQLAETASVLAALRSDGVPLTGVWALRDPIEVAVVPPTALGELDGDTACVAVDSEPQPVTVIGSELGQSAPRAR